MTFLICIDGIEIIYYPGIGIGFPAGLLFSRDVGLQGSELFKSDKDSVVLGGEVVWKE